MSGQYQESIRQMRIAFAQCLGAIPAHGVKKKPGMDEVSFEIGALIKGQPRVLGDFAGIAEGCSLENFSINRTPQGIQFVVRGYESLNILADLGCNFPGSSDYKTPSLKK